MKSPPDPPGSPQTVIGSRTIGVVSVASLPIGAASAADLTVTKWLSRGGHLRTTSSRHGSPQGATTFSIEPARLASRHDHVLRFSRINGRPTHDQREVGAGFDLFDGDVSVGFWKRCGGGEGEDSGDAALADPPPRNAQVDPDSTMAP